MAVRLARVVNTTPVYWVNLQTNHDMARAAEEIDVSDVEPLDLVNFLPAKRLEPGSSVSMRSD